MINRSTSHSLHVQQGITIPRAIAKQRLLHLKEARNHLRYALASLPLSCQSNDGPRADLVTFCRQWHPTDRTLVGGNESAREIQISRRSGPKSGGANVPFLNLQFHPKLQNPLETFGSFWKPSVYYNVLLENQSRQWYTI